MSMLHTQEALRRGRADAASTRFPITWSEGMRDDLRRMARGELPGHSPVDAALAGPLLLCAEGGFDEAERAILPLLAEHLASCAEGGEIFISLLYAVFVAQRLDLFAAMLRDRFAYPRPLEVAVQRDGPGRGRVAWDVLPDGTHRFTYDAAAYAHDGTRVDVLALQWEFPLYAHYAARPEQESGRVIINRQDIGETPGLAWCDNRPDYFLVPDCIFVPSGGYAYAREYFRQNPVAWEDRKPVAFWRGATTGIPAGPRDWRSLERVRLCETARRHAASGLFDVGLSTIKQFHDPGVIAEIEQSGLIGGFVPWEHWNRYRFLVEIDGNSSPWSNLFQRLLTGSPVLRVESARGLQQWYYDELVPWVNYVPIAPDMSDLVDKTGWLLRNDGVAQRIGGNGLVLAERLTYDREITRGSAVIAAAFGFFSGVNKTHEPFGRMPIT